jgi:hypothetical protein
MHLVCTGASGNAIMATSSAIGNMVKTSNTKERQRKVSKE